MAKEIEKQASEQKPMAVAPVADPPAEQARTFSQAEVDVMLGERAKRERAKFADYAELKTAKAELDEIEAAQLTALEQAQKATADATAQAAKALQTSQDRLIRAELTAQAAIKGAAHPGDAYNLADLAGVALGDDDSVTGAAEAVDALIAGGRMVMTTKAPAPDLNGGAGGGKRPDAVVKLTPEEQSLAKKWGLTPEEYAESKNR